MTEQDLAGRGVVVTGSSRGIGAATAELLAARGAGVVVNYRQKAPRANKVVQRIEDAGGRAVAVGGDVTVAEDRAALLDAAVRESERRIARMGADAAADGGPIDDVLDERGYETVRPALETTGRVVEPTLDDVDRTVPDPQVVRLSA